MERWSVGAGAHGSSWELMRVGALRLRSGEDVGASATPPGVARLMKKKEFSNHHPPALGGGFPADVVTLEGLFTENEVFLKRSAK